MITQQKDFSGGMNLLVNDTQIPEDQYKLLINGRNRLGYIQPILKPEVISALPSGLKQGIVSLGKVLIAFVAGKAYYNIDGFTAWQQIPAFSMYATADTYWTCAVPASTLRYTRKLNATGNVNDKLALSLDFTFNGTAACILVQDNVNQPWVIFFDTDTQTFTARVTQNYSQWTTANPEYVPIGKQMFTLNGKTFIVSRDGKSIMHSVSGRPLDFMINIDVNGNKLPSELKGGAAQTSFSFDSNEITCVRPVNIPDSFLYATAHLTRVVTLDYTSTIFDEPRVRQSSIINAGVVNNESFAEILGDYAFIDFENVKSFNAVQQLKFSGRNSVFSLMLASVLDDIKQTQPACVVFNNYGLFYLRTSLGNALAVYDMLREKWIGFDITEADRIKQFAIVVTDTESKLYAVTRDNKLYRMFSESSDRAMAQVFTRSIASDDIRNELKTNKITPLFASGQEDGECEVVELVDDKQGQRLTQTIDDSKGALTFPMKFPIMFDSTNLMDGVTYSMTEGMRGKKLAYIIQWNTSAKLQGFKLTATESTNDAALKQQGKAYADS